MKNATSPAPGSIAGDHVARITPSAATVAFVCHQALPMPLVCHRKDAVAVATLDYEKLQTFRRHWPFYLDFD